MSVRILGTVEAWAQQRRLDLGGRRQLALFSFLVLHANRAVSRDALIDAVWGSDRSRSDNRLSMAITRLRKALEPLNSGGESPLRTVSGGYMLALAPDELDSQAFADGVSAGRRALEAGNPGAASELVGQAVALWRGPPLAEVAFEDFAQPEIRRLEEMRLEALELGFEADLELGRHSHLVGELEGLLAEHPTRERMASQLMLALYRCGRQSDALEVYQRARAHLGTELGLEPGPALKTLQAQILEQAPSLAPSDDGASAVESSTHSRAVPVPLPATPTIGREREVEELCGLLAETDARLVTLTGPGGVGKTRLALAAAHAAAVIFEDGAVWAGLAGVTRTDDVASTVVRALTLTPVPGETPRDALIRYLSGKRLLLVIDNFEHVIDAAELIGELISASNRLKVLVTSREALDLSAEHRVLVGPLALPATSGQVSVTDVQSAPATALFVDAARRRNSRFAITDAHAPVVARICARLDGLPLALELAAARTDVLGIDELSTRLASIADLGTGPRDAPARQRTLSATIDWSYRLLDQDQQRAFVRFAVFAGGATLESAQEVTGAAANVLAALIAKSLLDKREQPDRAARLMMLETIRYYALERLNEGPEHDTTRRLHLEYYLELVERTVLLLATHQEGAALRALDDETDNIHGALRWALTAAPLDALRLAGQLGEYWWLRSDPNGLAWIDSALRAAGASASPTDRARAQLQLGYQLAFRHQHCAACEAGETALALCQEIEDDAGISKAYRDLAFFYSAAGDTIRRDICAQAACRHARLAGDDALLGEALSKLVGTMPIDAGLATARQVAELLMPIGNWRPIARAYNNVAFVAMKEGRIAQAIELLDVALGLLEECDSPPDLMITCGNIGLANLFAGNISRARAAFVRQLRVCVGQAYRRGADEGLAGIAAIAASNGRAEQSARLLGAARAMGYPGADPMDQVMYDRLEREFFAPVRASCGSDAWHRAEVAGAGLAYEQALAIALAQASVTGDKIPSPATDPREADPPAQRPGHGPHPSELTHHRQQRPRSRGD